jgi:cytochrome c oxidase subunit 1
MTLAVLLILANIVISLRKPIKAGDNPWNAYTLEWATSYPPPEFNFRHIPKITSEAPLLGMRQAEASEQNV